MFRVSLTTLIEEKSTSQEQTEENLPNHPFADDFGPSRRHSTPEREERAVDSLESGSLAEGRLRTKYRLSRHIPRAPKVKAIAKCFKFKNQVKKPLRKDRTKEELMQTQIVKMFTIGLLLRRQNPAMTKDETRQLMLKRSALKYRLFSQLK